MNNEETIKTLELKLAAVKAQITAQEDFLQSLWFDLLDVQSQLAAARYGIMREDNHE